MANLQFVDKSLSLGVGKAKEGVGRVNGAEGMRTLSTAPLKVCGPVSDERK